MPFDSTNSPTEIQPDLSKPSFKGLSWLLRHLPSTHKWDFEHVGGPSLDRCGSAGCALGLIIATWPHQCRSFIDTIPGEITNNLFIQGYYLPVKDKDVTPEMVADRIDGYLADGLIKD